MGYCYSGRKLCCDVCGTAGARKKKCPSGWCQPTAVCPSCAKDKEKQAKLKQYHVKNECAAKSAEFVARRAHEAALLAEGKAIRCSALGLDNGQVHVLFKLADGSCEGRYISSATYGTIPYTAPATPEDYAKHGEVLPAPSAYEYGKTAKQAA